MYISARNIVRWHLLLSKASARTRSHASLQCCYSRSRDTKPKTRQVCMHVAILSLTFTFINTSQHWIYGICLNYIRSNLSIRTGVELLSVFHGLVTLMRFSVLPLFRFSWVHGFLVVHSYNAQCKLRRRTLIDWIDISCGDKFVWAWTNSILTRRSAFLPRTDDQLS